MSSQFTTQTHLTELERNNEDAQKLVDEKSQNPHEVINNFKKWIQYLYLSVITEAEYDTSTLVTNLKKMYDSEMSNVFEGLFNRLVRDAVEVQEEDWNEDESQPLSMFDRQAKKFLAGTENPGGFVTTTTPIVEELCKWLVGRYESDETRKSFLDNYLILIKKYLDHCIELTCANLPGMNKILTEYTEREFEIMKTQFYAFDARIYQVYTGDRKTSLCPFQMMTATAHNPSGESPKTTQAPGDATEDELFKYFVDDGMLYMQSFTNKAKVDTNAILRHDAIRTFFERIDNNCF